MPSGRSPSGVASLRARFEPSQDSTSPPSRGRSPAGSVTSDSSRPLSKVRTSFVAVERSGQMADTLGVKPVGSNGDMITGDGAEDSKLALNGTLTDTQAKTNGNRPTSSTSEHLLDVSSNIEEPQTNEKVFVSSTSDPTSTATAGNPDKPVSTAEERAAGVLPADPKEEKAVSSGEALNEATQNLGSILKGSEFESEEAKKAADSQKPSPSESRELKQSKTLPAPKSNGRPKEALSPRPAGPPSSKPTQKIPPAPRTPTSGGAPTRKSPSKVASPNPKAPPSQPAASESLTASRSVPLTTTNPGVNSSKPVGTVAKKPPRASTDKLIRPSGAVKAPVSAPSMAAKKRRPTSPLAITKPRPRSPTRPVRLPASATAPTAASSAKLDNMPSSRSPSRASIGGSKTSMQNKLRPPPPRASMPPSARPIISKPVGKPKSRLSGADEGFLERMMRPTQSSASKTHDKVEVHTPPKKTHAVRPKRKSELDDEAKSEPEGEKEEKSSGQSAPSGSPQGKHEGAHEPAAAPAAAET